MAVGTASVDGSGQRVKLFPSKIEPFHLGPTVRELGRVDSVNNQEASQPFLDQ